MKLKDTELTPKEKPRAIVLGVEHPGGVAVIRSLGKAGVVVDAVVHRSNARGFYSRYIRRGFYSRYIRSKYLVSTDAECAIETLESLGQDDGGLLIPTNDHYIMLVAKNFDRLSQYFIMTSPPWHVLEKLMNRPQCYSIAQEAGIKTPRFFTPKDDDELKEIVSGLDFKTQSYILKTKLSTSGPADPRTRRFSRDAGPDAASLLERCREIDSRTGALPMIEEVVPGESDSCIGVSMVVDRNHEPVLTYCVRRLKLFLYFRRGFAHPYELGENVYCESTHDDEAAEAARRFVRQVKYFGMITVEFRRDVTDGTLNLIKADPRPVRTTSLSTALGLDSPTTLYKVFTGEKVNNVGQYPSGVAWVWLTWWASALLKNRRYSPVRKELFTVLRNFHRIKTFAFLNAQDPMPFVLDVGRGIGKGSRRWRKALWKRLLSQEL